MNCVFCEVANGRAPAHIVEETDDCIAIVPLDIQVDGHLVVIPKMHYNGIVDVPSETLGKVMDFVKKVCLDLKVSREFGGFNILNASGSAAQQSVPHFHVHILPRNEGAPLMKGVMCIDHVDR